MVLEKDDAISKLYVGTGTCLHEGVRGRWGQWDCLENVPLKVAIAIKDGYTVARKGILVWCLIHKAGISLPIYLLFLAMETALAFGLWAMYSTKLNHPMISVCLWHMFAFTYAGLYGHNPLLEGVEDLELTPAEFEAAATVYQCLPGQNSSKFQKWPGKYHERNKCWRKKVSVNRKFRCGVSAVTKYIWRKHLDNHRHKERVRQDTAGLVKRFLCDVCCKRFHS